MMINKKQCRNKKQKTNTFTKYGLPIKSDLISRGKQCRSNNIEIDSPTNHVLYQTWSVIIMIIIIIVIIKIVILIVMNSYIIIKDNDNDNDDGNNSQNKDNKKVLKNFKNWVYMNDHS